MRCVCLPVSLVHMPHVVTGALHCRCMCGAPTCRGTMDSQPERLKDFGKRIEVWWEGDNVYYRGTVIGFSKKAHKHTILYDDHESEKVSLDITPHR